MNKKFFIHQITVYHFNSDETITKTYLENVYFRHNDKINAINKGVELASTGTIIIPTTENVAINKDDYIIEGNINDEFNLLNLQGKYQVFKVVSVDDNRKGKLQHFKIGVCE